MAEGQYKLADVEAPAAGAGKYSLAHIETPPAPQQQGSVLGGMWDAAKGMVSGTAAMGWHTLQSLMGDDTALRKDAENAVNAQADQWRKAQEALKRGQRVEAVGHLGAALLPMIGPAAAHAGERMGGEMEYGDPQHPERVTGVVRPPDVRGGIGEGLVIAGAPLVPEVTARVAPAVARGAQATGTATLAGVKAGAGDVLVGSGKAAAGAVLAKAGPLGEVADVIAGMPLVTGGVKQVGRGIKTGIAAGKAALAERVNQAAAKARQATAPAPVPPQTPAGLLGPVPIVTPAPPDASFVRSVPGQYPAPEAPPLAPVRGLLPAGPNVVPMGAAADGSYVRSVPGQYPVSEAPPAPAPPAGPAPEFLEQLAQSLGGKPFAKLNQAEQQQVRLIADRISAPPQQAPVGPRIQPNMTRADVDALPPPAPQQAPVAAPAPTPAPAIEPQPAPVAATDPVIDSRSPYLANGEKKSPQLRGAEKKAYHVDQKGQRFAQVLQTQGITAKMANDIPLGRVPMEEIAKGSTPGWGNVTDDLIAKGLLDADEVLPNESVPSIIKYLKQREKNGKNGAAK